MGVHQPAKHKVCAPITHPILLDFLVRHVVLAFVAIIIFNRTKGFEELFLLHVGWSGERDSNPYTIGGGF